MNELHLVELGQYGVVMDVDHVNTLVTLEALEKQSDSSSQCGRISGWVRRVQTICGRTCERIVKLNPKESKDSFSKQYKVYLQGVPERTIHVPNKTTHGATAHTHGEC